MKRIPKQINWTFLTLIWILKNDNLPHLKNNIYKLNCLMFYIKINVKNVQLIWYANHLKRFNIMELARVCMSTHAFIKAYSFGRSTSRQFADVIEKFWTADAIIFWLFSWCCRTHEHSRHHIRFFRYSDLIILNLKNWHPQLYKLDTEYEFVLNWEQIHYERISIVHARYFVSTIL